MITAMFKMYAEKRCKVDPVRGGGGGVPAFYAAIIVLTVSYDNKFQSSVPFLDQPLL